MSMHGELLLRPGRFVGGVRAAINTPGQTVSTSFRLTSSRAIPRGSLLSIAGAYGGVAFFASRDDRFGRRPKRIIAARA
ncbi:MAG: hypothetical protein U5O16_40235 [Rhodococcus sp. (in: high G+C Gram-positive bacteria)]|uniref:hypothetical protein n=1 Tax=Rhodococcus sp. TaxID=1831 RepID=UPI002ADB0F7A|nr:hypothetical protein [Rhodococcus sp. (in: high G+C Gram-positive bacteria)]